MPSRSSAGSSSSLSNRICCGSDARSRSRDRREVLGRRPAVFRAAHDLRLDLLLDRRDANHEELVEVRSVDRDELQPLEQRIARVERLLEHAIVELEPRQLAADVERRIVERDDGNRCLRRLRAA